MDTVKCNEMMAGLGLGGDKRDIEGMGFIQLLLGSSKCGAPE